MKDQRREQLLAEMGIKPIWKLRAQSQTNISDEVAPVSESDVTESDLDVHAELPARLQENLPPNLSADRSIHPAYNMDWDDLQKAVSECRACRLCERRKQAVLGVGDQHADWLFVGEGPGAEEDERGEPFVGQAGKLLDAMLASVGMNRGKNLYIANAVKCRPPGNRTPELDEMAACRPYLERQIALIQPKLIVAMGRPAVQTLLGGEPKISSSRRKVFHFGNTPVVVTYHPAYLLRNLPDKAKAWEDLCFALDEMAKLQPS